MNQDRLSSAAESVDKIGTRKRNGMSFLGFPRSHLLTSVKFIWTLDFFIKKKHLDSGLRSTDRLDGTRAEQFTDTGRKSCQHSAVSFNKTDLFLDGVTKQTYQPKQIPVKLKKNIDMASVYLIL